MSKQTKKLLSENNQLEKALTDEYQLLMTDIVCYIRSFPITMKHQEFVRKDITHMLINAQNNHQQPQDVFGDDFKQFCDDIILELPKMSKKDRIMIAIGNNCLYIMILLLILVLSKGALLLANPDVFPIITLHISELIQILIIIFAANFVGQFICKTAFQRLTKRNYIFIIVIFCLTIAFAFFGSYALDNIIFHVNIFACLLIIVLLFFIQKYIDKVYE